MKFAYSVRDETDVNVVHAVDSGLASLDAAAQSVEDDVFPRMLVEFEGKNDQHYIHYGFRTEPSLRSAISWLAMSKPQLVQLEKRGIGQGDPPLGAVSFPGVETRGDTACVGVEWSSYSNGTMGINALLNAKSYRSGQDSRDRMPAGWSIDDKTWSETHAYGMAMASVAGNRALRLVKGMLLYLEAKENRYVHLPTTTALMTNYSVGGLETCKSMGITTFIYSSLPKNVIHNTILEMLTSHYPSHLADGNRTYLPAEPGYPAVVGMTRPSQGSVKVVTASDIWQAVNVYAADVKCTCDISVALTIASALRRSPGPLVLELPIVNSWGDFYYPMVFGGGSGERLSEYPPSWIELAGQAAALILMAREALTRAVLYEGHKSKDVGRDALLVRAIMHEDMPFEDACRCMDWLLPVSVEVIVPRRIPNCCVFSTQCERVTKGSDVTGQDRINSRLLDLSLKLKCKVIFEFDEYLRLAGVADLSAEEREELEDIYESS